MQIQQVVNRIFKSNTYIISTITSQDVWLVDIGDLDLIQQKLQSNQNIKGLFITHSHFDHIYGLNDLVEQYPSVKLFISEDGAKGLYDDKKNFSLYHEAPLNFHGGNVCVVQDGDSIEIFDEVYVECFYTPGHDTSCMTFKCGDYLFTGDSYIPNEKPVTNLKGGNKKDYAISLEKIKKLINQKTILCPGHGVMGDVYKKV